MRRRSTEGRRRTARRSLLSAARRTGRPGASRSFALLLVVLTIAALLLLATPFLVSMRLQERSSQYAVAGARGGYAVNAAYNHALAQLMRAADEYGDLVVTFDDLPAEFQWSGDGSSLLLAATVEDEQGKVNANTAGEDVLARLFIHALELSAADAASLAADLAAERLDDGPFATLGTLVSRAVLTTDRLDGADPWLALAELRRHLTVHSAGTGAFSPVNINACSIPVLRSVLAGVRLAAVTATADDGNTGDGSMSLVSLDTSAAGGGEWTVTCTDVTTDPATGAVTWTFTVTDDEGGGGETVELTEQPGWPASSHHALEEFAFTLTAGETPFAVGDSFAFSTQRFGYDGAAYDPAALDALIRRLRATVVSADTDAGTITLDDASGFPAAGWIGIRGDFIHYASRAGNVLSGCTERTITPARGDVAVRVVPDMEAFGAILDAAVEADEISPDDRSAILASASDPADGAALLEATTGLCFGPAGRYTIEAIGVVNDRAGSEVERRRVRRVVHLEHGSDRAWTLATQADFDQEVAAHRNVDWYFVRELITTPNPTYLADVPPSDETTDAGVTLAPLDGWGSGWSFDGPTVAGAAQWRWTRGGPPAGTTLDPETDLFRNGDRGLYVASGSAGFKTFAARAELYVDILLRRFALWVKPAETFDPAGSHVFFDVAADGAADHWNRIRVAYESGELVFRIADETAEDRSAEVRATTALSTGVWHKIEALWAGADPGRMALMLDGRLVGSYHPSGAEAESTGLPDEEWIARVGNYLEDADAEGVRETKKSAIADPPPGPKTVYGYGGCEFINRDESTNKLAFNRVHRGGATLAAALEQKYASQIPDIKEGDPPESVDPPLTAAGTEVPVADASGFPDEGYVRIDDEIIKYDGITTATDAAGTSYYKLAVDATAPGNGRGQDFGDTPATEFTSSAADHAAGAAVVCVSVELTSNAGYPMPHYVDIDDGVEDWFDLEGLDRNTCFVQVGEEWISYTHRAGTDFLVNAAAEKATRNASGGGTIETSSMRGAAGTAVDDQATGADVLPVYRVTSGGRIGGGDRVTLLDDDTSPGECEERVVARAEALSKGETLSAFTEFVPPALAIYVKKGERPVNARLAKFPSGWYTPQRYVAIGGPASGTGGAAEATIGEVLLSTYPWGSADTSLRLRGTTTNNHATPVVDGIATTDAGADLVFGTLDALFDADDSKEWQWADSDGMFGTGSWPLAGLLKVGDEALFYKVRWPHRIHRVSDSVARTRSPTVTAPGAIAATGNVVVGEDPIEAGFNPHGGYLVITSYKKTEHPGGTRELTTDPDTLQWLIDQGHITEEQRDQGTQDPETGDWTFTEDVPGSSSTSHKREYVFYSEIRADDPGLGEYTFVCAGSRHLYDSHTDEDGNPLPHDDPADSPPPTLTGRTVALSVLGRARLGTTASEHPAGSRILPLPNVPATVMFASPFDENDQPIAAFQTDRIPVEDHGDFPPSGYLEIRDGGGGREIIYYTHKTEETVADSDPIRTRCFFNGVKHFRGRFGTTPIDLTGLERFDDVRDTSTEQMNAYKNEPQRQIRLFRPRFHDRMPLAIPVGEPEDNPRRYTPHADDDDLVFFRAKKSVRGATWKSIRWTADVPEGTAVVVLARLGDSPEWGRAGPVPWDEVDADSGRVIYLFDDPDAANTIDRTSDTIEVRVFFKFERGYDLSSWRVPALRSLTARYRSAANVLQSEELGF